MKKKTVKLKKKKMKSKRKIPRSPLLSNKKNQKL